MEKRTINACADILETTLGAGITSGKANEIVRAVVNVLRAEVMKH